MSKPTSNVPSSVTPSTEAPVPVPTTVALLVRYNYGGTAQNNAVPALLVPHGGRSPDGSTVTENTALYPEGKTLPSAKEAGKGAYFPVQRVTVNGASYVMFVPAGSRTYEAAQKALESLGLEAGGLASLSHEEFEKEAARIAKEEAEKVLARLRAKREALGLLRK